MRNVSTRALGNLVVDAVIAVAFAVAAVSGLVFMMPPEWFAPPSAPDRALGVGFATWRAVHDWSALVMIGGVVLHTALHWRWITSMAHRLAGAGPAQDRPVRRPAAGRAAGGEQAETSAASSPSVGTHARLDRKAFITRAAAVAVATLAGGLVGRRLADALLEVASDPGGATRSGGAWVTESARGGGNPPGASTDDDPATDDSGDADASLPGVDAASARVAVDGGRCTGCGACVAACPYGVFTMNADRAVVADAAACRLCGRCTRTCHAAAITLQA